MSDYTGIIPRFDEHVVSPKHLPRNEVAEPRALGDTVIINTAPPPETWDTKVGRGLVNGGRKANKFATEKLGLWGSVFLASVLSSTATYGLTHYQSHVAMAELPIVYTASGAAEGNL